MNKQKMSQEEKMHKYWKESKVWQSPLKLSQIFPEINSLISHLSLNQNNQS